MSFRSLTRQNRWIDAFSIIPDTQPKLLMVITNVNLDLSCAGVPKGVPKRLARNLVDLITKYGM